MQRMLVFECDEQIPINQLSLKLNEPIFLGG